MPLESWKPTRMEPRWDALQRDPDEFFQSIVEMLASALNVPVVMISVLHEEFQFVRAAHGWKEFVADRMVPPLDQGLCQHVVAMGRPLAVPDTWAHPLTRENSIVIDLNVAAYVGEPLHGTNGKPIGALCVMDTRPRDWTDTQRSMISISAMIVEKALSWPNSAHEFPA